MKGGLQPIAADDPLRGPPLSRSVLQRNRLRSARLSREPFAWKPGRVAKHEKTLRSAGSGKPMGETMDFDTYRNAFFVQPAPRQRFEFKSAFGATVYFESFEEAVAFYGSVLGPPAYVEGDGTRGWPIGNGWLTLLKGEQGNPKNVEITLELETSSQAEALQADFVASGATGQAPSDQLMYRPVRCCPVTDPFGLHLMIIAPLDPSQVAG